MCIRDSFDTKGFDYDLKFDWTIQAPIESNPTGYPQALANQEAQAELKVKEGDKDEEDKEVGGAQVVDKITQMLEGDREVSIEVNYTGKSQTFHSKENQDRTGSTTADKPPAPAPAVKDADPTAPKAAPKKIPKTTKKCGCSIFCPPIYYPYFS
eukprot:TRINITY_DN11200_c0_g1_i4.p1 TRINITY_DN11200_c0_g1~~TRINITY_DN11200_c0_g1_i4.p1  ORF type:complete len:154 (+),score=38.30 TRINITY_DN11200_c0_g1_i4:73-534(+)